MRILHFLQRILTEARRRRVFRTATIYVVGAWAVIQVGDLVFEAWGFGEQALRNLFVGALLGFPIALLFGWRYDITRHGIVRTPPVSPGEFVDSSLQRLDYLILLLLAGAASATIWTVANESMSTTGQTPPAAVELAPNSIAVLPFRDLGAESGTSYLGDGLSYELTSYLTRLPNLLVTASSSVFALQGRNIDVRQVGQQLRVRYVVEGVIQSANNRLRIDVRLVDTQSGFNVWQDALDRDFYDVLELQSEVASQVVRNMQAVLADTATTLPAMDVSTVPEAYDSYLVGMHEFRNTVDRERTGDWVDRAIGHLQRAVDADPEFALAYAKLARVNLLFLYTIRAEYFDESIATARRLVERALVLEPDLDVAYTTLGHIYFLENDAVAREQAIRRALELNPGNSEALLNLADLLWRKGRLHEAQEFVRAAAVRDPLNASAVALNADLDAKLGDYPAAREQLLALMRNTPDNPPYRALTQLERQFGHFDEAARWVRQNYLRHPDNVFASMDANRAAFELDAQDLAENWMRTLASGPVDYMIPQRIQVLLNEERMAEATHLINTRIAEIYTPGKETQLQPREAMLRAGATMVNFVAGDYETTLQHFARIQGNRETIVGLADRIELLTVASWSATRLGRPGTASEFLEEARLLIDLIEDFGATEFPPFTIARAHWNAAAGEHEQALVLLDAAIEQGNRNLLQLRLHPLWRSYSEDPRYLRALKKVQDDIAAQRERAIKNGWLVGPGQ